MVENDLAKDRLWFDTNDKAARNRVKGFVIAADRENHDMVERETWLYREEQSLVMKYR
jgi:hypothetical protein